MARESKLVEPQILRRAIVDSFVKLNPRTLMRNPVMFVVGVGSVLTTILFFKDLGLVVHERERLRRPRGAVPVVHRAVRELRRGVAEGRGKAQADTLRKTRSETVAHRRRPDGTVEEVAEHRARRRRRVCRQSRAR